MAGFVQGIDREQVTLFPARLDEYVAEDNPVRAVDAFVDGLDVDGLGFIHVQPLDIGRPGYHPRMMLKLYIYGYLNRVPSNRRLERECQRNIGVIWLTGGGGRPSTPRNVLGDRLEVCSSKPMTGFFRDGCCDTSREDIGSHTVCAGMTAAFLEFSKSRGNDLSTPIPEPSCWLASGHPRERFRGVVRNSASMISRSGC
jgi:uncharacterized protein DUF2237/transposase-like protein DUF772